MQSSKKHKAARRFGLAGFLVVGLTLGCVKDDNEELNEKREEAVKATQEYAYVQKADFIFQMHRELSVLQNELDRLSAKVEESTGTAKAEAKARLEAVRAKWATARTKLDQAEQASTSAWNDMKQNFNQSYDELNESLDEARRWLSDKIEPD
jgi:soluble cytochrome b562